MMGDSAYKDNLSDKLKDIALDKAWKENEALAKAIEELQANALTPEEYAYLRNKKEADERASWAWHMLRTYLPWVTAVISATGTVAYWLVSNFQVRQP